MKWSHALITFALLGACSDSTAPTITTRDESALFQTDSLAYAFAGDQYFWRATVAYAFTNKTSKTVSFATSCGGGTSFVVQKRVDGAWIDVWSETSFHDCLGTPIVVAANETRIDSARVMIPYASLHLGADLSASDLTGTFRIFWPDALHDYSPANSNFGTLIPLAQRISNRFNLRAEAPPAHPR